MANGQKFSDPRRHVGNVQPGSYPIDYTGSAPNPQRTAEPGLTKEFQLMMDSHGKVEQVGTPEPEAQGTMQTSQPPAEPSAAAEAEDFKKRFGDLMNDFGELKRQHSQQMEEMRLQLELAQSGRSAPQLPQYQVPQGVDPEQELKVRDLYAVLPQMAANLAEVAQAQALRASWDVTPEEEAEVYRQYPQVANYSRESERLAFIKRVVGIRRRYAQEKKAAPSAVPSPVAAPQQTRPAQPTVPQPEASVSAPIADAAPESGLQAAIKAYESLKQRLDRGGISDLERKNILQDMRTARDAILRLQGITEAHEREMRVKSSL